MENSEFLGLRVGISWVSFFLKFLQINNNIPYPPAALKNYFLFETFLRKPLKIKNFELPPPAYKKKHMKKNRLRCTPDVLY